MARIQLNIESTEVERVTKILAGVEGGARKAIYNVIERAQAKVCTETTKAITSVYAINLQNLRAATNIKSRTRTEADRVTGEITFSGNKIPLYRFDVTPRARQVTSDINKVFSKYGWIIIRASAPVSATIKRGGAKVQSETAFIAKTKSGHIGVFERVGINSLPIQERMGLATAQMAENSMVIEDVEREAQATMEKRLEHEINRILNGFGR